MAEQDPDPTPSVEVDLSTGTATTPPEAPLADQAALNALTAEERLQWRLTGEMPERKMSPSKTEGSTPPQPGDPAASTEVSQEPASEPGKPAKPNAETRKQQLNAEIQALLTQRAQLRAEVEQRGTGTGRAPDAAPAGSSPAAPTPVPAPSFPSFEDFLAQPGNDGRTYEDYTRALVDHAFLERAMRAADDSAKVERLSGFRAQLVEAVNADPSFWNNVSQELQDLVPVDQLPRGAPVHLGNVAAQLIAESSVAPQVLRYLSEHGEALAALKAETTPQGIARLMGRIEGQLMGATPVTSPAVTAPVVSRAPAPAPTLGKQPAVPTDDADAALQRHDFQAYREAMNRKELAAKR
jgi:hypothetical protein